VEEELGGGGSFSFSVFVVLWTVVSQQRHAALFAMLDNHLLLTSHTPQTNNHTMATQQSKAAIESMAKAAIESMAKAVYEQCLQAPSGYLFSVAEIQGLVPGKNNLELTQRVINELLQTRSLSALTQGSQTVFRAVPTDYAEKYEMADSVPCRVRCADGVAAG
jgi:hypothetical protein